MASTIKEEGKETSEESFRPTNEKSTNGWCPLSRDKIKDKEINDTVM